MLIGLGTAVKGQRLVKGKTGIEAGAGILANRQLGTDNLYAYIGLTVNKTDGAYMFYQAEYQRKTYNIERFQIPVERYSGKVGYSFPILKDPGRNFLLNLGLAANAGYTEINRSDYVLPSGAVIQNRSGFIYGGSSLLSFEVFITDQVQILFRGNLDILFGNTVSRLNPNAGLGIRFIL